MLGRATVPVAIMALLGGCGEPTIEGELGNREKIARQQACSRIYRTEGYDQILLSTGGGDVDQIAFDALGPAKQRRLAELVACLRSGGAVEPMDIQFYNSGRNLRRIRAANDIDFAAGS
jgi:hypothetical protein